MICKDKIDDGDLSFSIQFLLIEKMNRQNNLLQKMVDNHDSPVFAHSQQFSNSFILWVYFTYFLFAISNIQKVTIIIRNKQIVYNSNCIPFY